MQDDDSVVLGLRTEIREAARNLQNLAQAAGYIGRPELSGMLDCMAGLLEEQAVSWPWSRTSAPISHPRRQAPVRRARVDEFAQRA